MKVTLHQSSKITNMHKAIPGVSEPGKRLVYILIQTKHTSEC